MKSAIQEQVKRSTLQSLSDAQKEAQPPALTLAHTYMYIHKNGSVLCRSANKPHGDVAMVYRLPLLCPFPSLQDHRTTNPTQPHPHYFARRCGGTLVVRSSGTVKDTVANSTCTRENILYIHSNQDGQGPWLLLQAPSSQGPGRVRGPLFSSVSHTGARRPTEAKACRLMTPRPGSRYYIYMHHSVFSYSLHLVWCLCLILTGRVASLHMKGKKETELRWWGDWQSEKEKITTGTKITYINEPEMKQRIHFA